MHLISTIPGGWNPNDEGVFHIDQSPGDIVFLSAADTDLYIVNKAYHHLAHTSADLPTLRMANLTYFKQELTIDTYLDEVIRGAKIVVLKLLGGKAYFHYLCEAIEDFCVEENIKLIFLPGDNKPDLDLMSTSSLPLSTVDQIWKYLLAGGLENSKAALQLIINEIQETKVDVKTIDTIPELFFYHPKQGIVSQNEVDNRGEVMIFTYRSYFLAGNLDPLDTLIYVLEQKGLKPVALMASGYREANLQDQIHTLSDQLGLAKPKVLINTAGFSIQGFADNDDQGIFNKFNVPVLQAIMASCNYDSWLEGDFGLPPTDIAMNIALPEVDGKIITKAISFKQAEDKDALTDSEVVSYVANKEGCEWVASMAQSWVSLQSKANADKKIALILPNYPNKNSRLANGVGLDTPQSTLTVLESLKSAGYLLDDSCPHNTEELIDTLTKSVTNSLDSINTLKEIESIRLDEKVFFEHYQKVSPALRAKVERQWGKPEESPYYKDGVFLIPGFVSGNVFLSIQPSRGYNLDLQASYHSPDLPPTYAYFAYYIWVQQSFQSDAIIHIGKHGNLEWLPGKSVALSDQTCFPSAILGPIPHFYPFIINDPGEGTQAKRRNQAVILDHLIPPMTRAENHGDLLKLELLIDEFYESALVDRKRADLIKKKIEQLVNESNLKKDLNGDDKEIDELLEVIDGYLCELKEAQIRGGLHIFGRCPEDEKLIDLVVALHRFPQGELMGITQALAKDLKLGFDPLSIDYQKSLGKEIYGVSCRTYGQAIEILEQKSSDLVGQLMAGLLKQQDTNTAQILQYIESVTLPLLVRTEDELGNLLQGLAGRYVPAGGSGAPTRGRMDILPTGRNFYSVDVRTIPSETAYELGQKSAQNIIDRYLQENGEYPTSIGVSVWGTSTMRTGGDDIAQAFALMGVKPVWQGSNRRVKDFEVISTLELKRPRIDVMLRISGFFRDAFPDIISLFNAAVEKIAHLDETSELNPIKAKFDIEKSDWIAQGLTEKQATERAQYRVFGSKPGAYGAGLQGLIDEGNWSSSDDLAQAYINWSGYAYYGNDNSGRSAHETFEKRLSSIEVVIQNQDNREHDLLDSDDYYQFQGGMTAAVNKIKGEQPEVYFGDHSRPESPRIKSLKEELLKVFRSRVINPKWINAMQEHGYKGAFEMAATMDYLFAYDATTNLIEDFMYEAITDKYLLEEENQAFIKKHNPWALKDMSERMLEAIQRGLWQEPSPEIVQELKKLYLESDNNLE